MGILLQIIGVFVLLVSLVLSILAIINNSSKILAIVLLIVGGSLIKIGRNIYTKHKP